MEFEEYFQSHNNYFWQWEDNEEVVAITGGSTIAYRDFIIEIFKNMAPQGIPPFGSLLLSLVATNPNAKESLDHIYYTVSTTLKTTDNFLLSDAITFLKVLADVPKEYKEGKKRILLLQTIFEACHNINSTANSNRIIAGFVSNTTGPRKISAKKEFTQSVFIRDFKTIALLVTKFPDAESIIERIAGVPKIAPEIIELQENPLKEKEPGDLIEELIENDKTFHVGALVKRIWSGLHIPFHNSMPSQQPLGGVADLTNKGDFDKLLISEFANDDIIFLSRLANNEALYFNREIPPENNDLKRVILIDVSIKNWGTPKTIAFAVMLAIAKHPKSTINCEAFAVGKNFHPVSLESVHTLIDSLQILEGALHAAEGIELFLKEYENQKNVEVIYISTADAIRYPAVQKVISENYRRFDYWIHPSAEGDISLFKRQNNSKKHVQDIRLPLEELWKREIRVKPTKERRTEITEYPILFRNSLNARKILTTSDGETFKVTSDKQLFRFYDKEAKYHEKGWELYCDKLPFVHGDAEMGLASNGDYYLLLYNPQNKEIAIINVNTGEQKMVSFDFKRTYPYWNLFFHNDMFYYLTYNYYRTISLNGEVNRVDKRDEELEEAYKLRQKLLGEASNTFYFGQGVFKNIKNIFINERNNLVLNVHELQIQNNVTIKLEKTTASKSLLESSRTALNEFRFPDGSTVTIDRGGMLVLRSSDQRIPVIYLPSVIESALGIATENIFTGNLYYYKDALKYNVVLNNAGPNKLATVKVIKDESGKGLKEAKDMVDCAPSSVLTRMGKERAWRMKRNLEEVGATVTVNQLDNVNNKNETEIVKPKIFFDEYINPFIQQILNYGNKN